MKIYMDVCCFNRPFDDQTQLKIRLETEAKLFVQQQILSGEYDLVWSYILDLENRCNPYEEKRHAIQAWKDIAGEYCAETEQIVEYAESLYRLGIKPKDALHISCAVHSNCDYFITTDKKLLNTPVKEIPTVSPIGFIDELEG